MKDDERPAAEEGFDLFAALLQAEPAAVALRQMQLAALEDLKSKLSEKGWPSDSLHVVPRHGCILAARDGEPQLVYAQAFADRSIRERFETYRSMLPPTARIQNLPREQVGALPTLDVKGVIGYAPDEADEFIAVSIGSQRLHVWALAVAKAHGALPIAKDWVAPDGSGLPPQQWWRNALLPLAYDIMGYTVDPVLSATIEVMDLSGSDRGEHAEFLRLGLEGFVFFHEFGHYELDHGREHREQARKGGVTSEQRYRMEGEADLFAIQAMTRVMAPGDAATAVSFLFLLLALAPDLLRRYPFSPDSQTYPHPLTRLTWVLRALFPDDRQRHSRYLTYVIQTLMPLIAEATGEDVDCMDEAMLYVLLNCQTPPKLNRVWME